MRQRAGRLSDDSANCHLFRLICRSVLLPRLILLEGAAERRGDGRKSVHSKNPTKSMYQNKMPPSQKSNIAQDFRMNRRRSDDLLPLQIFTDKGFDSAPLPSRVATETGFV